MDFTPDSIELEQYIDSHIDPESPALKHLDRITHLRTLAPRMLSGHQQGSLLKMLVRMINPALVLEVGTFTGYSAISMAQGLSRPDAVIHTVEVDDELEGIIRQHFQMSGLQDRIVLHIGDARQVADSIKGDFDLIFLDGDKREYPDYYSRLLPRLKHGGFLIADNTLWSGKVVSEPKHNDLHTIALKQFNDMVANDISVEKTIVNIRDGLTILRKK